MNTRELMKIHLVLMFLDLGAGGGNHTPLFQYFKYIAVDISKTIYAELASSAAESKNMIFLKAWSFSLQSKSVNFIFSFNIVIIFPLMENDL